MCRCKQRKDYRVSLFVDESAMSDGYDGDIEAGEDVSDWVAYWLLSERYCRRCDDLEHVDSVGAIWVLPHQIASDVLRETILQHGLVPARVNYDVIDNT